MTERKSGRTSRQIAAAPRGAVFVCPTWNMRDYARDLAKQFLRDDLHIITKHSILEKCEALGWPPVVLDHSIADVWRLRLKPGQADELDRATKKAAMRESA